MASNPISYGFNSHQAHMKKFTVKDLRKKLEKAPDDYIVEVYNRRTDNDTARDLIIDNESKTIYIID